MGWILSAKPSASKAGIVVSLLVNPLAGGQGELDITSGTVVQRALYRVDFTEQST